MVNTILYFSFYHTRVKVITNDLKVARFIQTDFSWFYQKNDAPRRKPDITLSVLLGRPPLDRYPEGIPVFIHTKEATVYRQEKVIYYVYSPEDIVVYDDRRDVAEIYSRSRDFLYERAYLMIMSRVGVELDRKRLHRIHAMGVVFNTQAILCLMPMGGGKTTLALSLLEKENISLLSDEVPLASPSGRLYPMPIRLGVSVDTELAIADEYLKPFQRSKHGPKTLIDAACFKDRIASAAEPAFVFLGYRKTSDRPRIKAISGIKAFGPLFRLCVIGKGLPELLEYALRLDLLNIIRHVITLSSRLLAITALIRRSGTYELHLSEDRSANAELVMDFVKGKPGKRNR